MKVTYLVGLSMLAGAVIGTAAIQAMVRSRASLRRNSNASKAKGRAK
jgi:hypothetical protein